MYQKDRNQPLSNHSILTQNAFMFWIKNIPQGRKYKLTEADWDSIYLYESMETQRDYIVDGIMQKIEDKFFTV